MERAMHKFLLSRGHPKSHSPRIILRCDGEVRKQSSTYSKSYDRPPYPFFSFGNVKNHDYL